MKKAMIKRRKLGAYFFILIALGVAVMRIRYFNQIPSIYPWMAFVACLVLLFLGAMLWPEEERNPEENLWPGDPPGGGGAEYY